MAITLTSGEVKVIGNCGDKHLFRLGNPEGQGFIVSDGEYDGVFISPLGRKEVIDIDTSDSGNGFLSFTVVIKNGVYIIRKINPQRTLIKIGVESQ